MKEPKELQFDSKTGLPIPGTAPELERPPQDPTFRFDLTGLITVIFLYGCCMWISMRPITLVACLFFCALILYWGGLVADAFSSEGMIFRVLMYLFVAFGMLAFIIGVYFLIRFMTVDRKATDMKILDGIMMLICGAVFVWLLSWESKRAERTHTRDLGSESTWYWAMLLAGVAFAYVFYTA